MAIMFIGFLRAHWDKIFQVNGLTQSVVREPSRKLSQPSGSQK